MDELTHKQALPPFRPLKRKLLYAIIIVSTLLTSIVIFFHFKFEYSKDLLLLDEKLLQISKTTIPSITRAAWNEDRSYLQVHVESIAKLQDVERVRVLDLDNEVLAESYNDKGNFSADSKNHRVYRYPLYYKNNPKQFLGIVEVIATSSNIKLDLYQRLAFFITAQVIKTFFISWIILIIFHYYISRNIEQIIDFIQGLNLNSINEASLQIKRKSKTRDEINTLQDAINLMIKKINYLNREKENKISQQEKKLEQQKASVITSSKMAALGEVAGSIAHEINDPLTVIHSKTRVMEKMIEEGISDNTLFLKNTKSILGTVDHISDVIRGVRSLSRDASDEVKTDAILKNLLSPVFNLCEQRFKNHNIELLCDLNAHIFETHLNCFPTQLSQCFLILINNSFEALDKLETKWIKIEAAQNKKWIFLHFIDSGPGIPKAVREKIFEPFFSTKEVGIGSGLGLSLALEVINKHGGEIFYDDHYQNTCFTIKLPLKEKKSILVVDDDIDIREAICKYLQQEGYKTIEAYNGKDALKLVKDQKIEFVISDIRMPDGGGLFLVDELRKIDRLLPYVILVTGQSDISREEAIERGALDLLKKPLEMNKIIGLIKYIENSYNEFVEM